MKISMTSFTTFCIESITRGYTIARKCCLKGEGNADILETSTNKPWVYISCNLVDIKYTY